MSYHPINLAVRFLLELVSLGVISLWGFKHGEGATRFVLAVGAPLAAATIWGVFAVPHDRSRSGSAPIPVPGVLRLVLEVGFFGAAVWALVSVDRPALAVALGSITAVHYGVSHDRIRWLLRA